MPVVRNDVIIRKDLWRALMTISVHCGNGLEATFGRFNENTFHPMNEGRAAQAANSLKYHQTPAVPPTPH